MKPTTAFLQACHLAQFTLASYGAYQSYIAIKNLRKYEETTKKLAKWSSEAECQLHKTRTTHTSGALAVTASLLSSILLATTAPLLPQWVRFAASPALLVITLFARGHINNFWRPDGGKTVGTRVPLPNMGDYNVAQRATERLLQTLEWLEYSWVGTSFVVGMLGY